MARALKITMLPAPGGHTAAGLAGSYDQQEFVVDDTFSIDVLQGEQWLQFETDDGTEYAFDLSRIVAVAVQDLLS